MVNSGLLFYFTPFMKKKILIIILVVLLILLLIGIVKWYRFRQGEKYPTLLEPRLEFMVAHINQISKEETDMEASMLVKNPLPVGITFDSISYQLYINQKLVVKSAYADAFHLNGNDSTMLSFPIIIRNKVLFEELDRLKENNTDSADYTVEGKIYPGLPGAKDRFFKFHISRKLPALRIPEIKVTKIRIKKIGMKHTKMVIETKIKNDNVFSVRLSKLNYRLLMDDDSLVTGIIDSTITIGEKSESVISFPADLNLKEAAEATFDLLLNAEKTRYALLLQTTAESDLNMLKKSRLIIESEGKLKEIKELR